MSFFKKIKDFSKMVTDLEYNISSNKQDFIEVYERNLQLEQEIVQRTQELNEADQALLTLKHVWEMMNSAQPLSNVLEKIVNSLHGEMGYINSTIIQKFNTPEDGEYYQVKAFSQARIIQKFTEQFKKPFSEYKIVFNENSIFLNTLHENQIQYTNKCAEFIEELLRGLEKADASEILKFVISESIIIVPIIPNNKLFGFMLVFSPRKEVTEKELSFLGLFAHQVEIAVTIANLFEAVKKEAITDPLTELYNRRHFEECLRQEVERSERLKQPFSIISLDLDYLKRINDTYGHSFGDIAIKTIAKVLKRNARSIDVPSRFGGEEFSVLLPGIDSEGAMIAAERIRASIEAESIEKVGNVTASIGVATYLEHSKDIDELLELADQAMYKAKIYGRNQVQLAKVVEERSWQEVAIEAFLDILSKKRIPISKNITKDLSERLSNLQDPKSNAKNMLYTIVDMLSQTYNSEHIEGVTQYKVKLATELAKKLELPRQQIDKLKIAMLLYDIGNIMLPEAIFKKEGPLSDEEKDIIKTHPIIASREILKPISSISDVIPIIEHHHENWDGTGYPAKISGETIPITSQVVLLIDAYVALTQNRVYREALTKEEALEAIKKESGTKWNAELVNDFVETIQAEDSSSIG